MSDRAQWLVLGAGSILPRAGYGCAGYALQPAAEGPWTLFDCGPGSLRQLGEHGLGLEQVERVVLSHYHPDHCLDLFALFFARRNPEFARPPALEVIGPPGLVELVRGVAAGLGRSVADPRAELREFGFDGTGRWSGRAGPLALSAQANGHTPQAVSWRAELPSGARLVYSGDTGPDPRVARLARDADLFVCECSFPDERPSEHHLTPRQAGRLAREAQVGELLLTHFYPGLDPEQACRAAALEYGGPIRAARDGTCVPLAPRAD